jgi:hypothetical protein
MKASPNQYRQYSYEQLLTAIRLNDRDALEEVMDRLEEPLFAMAIMHYSGQGNAAEIWDISINRASRVFIEFWNRRQQLPADLDIRSHLAVEVLKLCFENSD